MDISQLTTQMLSFSQQASQNVQSQLDANNVIDPEGMLKVQYALFQYTVFLNCTSSLIKDFKDLVSSIIAKI